MRDPDHIFRWQRLDDRLTTSGQPTEPELAEIAALGVRHIVNLGLHSHERALPDEAAAVAALGMTYIHIPVAFDQPTDADFAAFCRTLADLDDQPVHVHCIVNARVSAFFYRYRRDVLGWDEAAARAAMEAIGSRAASGRRSSATMTRRTCRIARRVTPPDLAIKRPGVFPHRARSSAGGTWFG